MHFASLEQTRPLMLNILGRRGDFLERCGMLLLHAIHLIRVAN
jgi:hypothetical protein